MSTADPIITLHFETMKSITKKCIIYTHFRSATLTHSRALTRMHTAWNMFCHRVGTCSHAVDKHSCSCLLVFLSALSLSGSRGGSSSTLKMFWHLPLLFCLHWGLNWEPLWFSTQLPNYHSQLISHNIWREMAWVQKHALLVHHQNQSARDWCVLRQSFRVWLTVPFDDLEEIFLILGRENIYFS